MATISDIIEAFLLETLGDDDTINISRNELASYFSVAPSQINYVLSTRFTPAKGYVIRSQRGGGGSITVVRLNSNPNAVLTELINRPPNEGFTYNGAVDVLVRLNREGLLTKSECEILQSVLSDKALLSPTVMQKDSMRASILKAVAQELMKRK